MIRIDLGFLLLGAVCLITGVSLGIVMGIAHDFQLAPLHAHINLVGWASLAIFGLVYRAYPALARSRLALTHFVVSAVAALIFLVGLYFAVLHQMIAAAVIGALLWLLGAVLFLINLARLTFSGAAVETARGDAVELSRAA
jgi:hypothetical protein